MARQDPTARTIQNLLINDSNLFEGLLERLIQSNENVTIDELEWTFSIDASSLNAGRGTIKKPPWARRIYTSTWEDHTFIDQMGFKHPINCAAFALCTSLYNSSILPVIRRRAHEMTQKYEWGDTAPMNQVLEFFTRDYSTYRVTILMAGFHKFEEHTRCGKDFVYEVNDITNLPTAQCQKKIIYLFLQLGIRSIGHYGLVRSPASALQSMKSWCHKCVMLYTRIIGAPVSCCCIEGAQDIRSEMRRKHAEMKPPKLCEFCNQAPCAREDCSRKCGICKINLKKGYDLSKGEGHRCILRDVSKDPPLYPNYGYNATKIFVYDFETQTVNDTANDQMFITKDHRFVLDGEDVATNYVARRRHVVNLIACINIFEPNSLLVFKNGDGVDAMTQFLSYILSHNDGSNICIAHNGGGFDTRLIYEYALNMFDEKKIKAIINGCKIMNLRIKKTVFIDSLLHLTGSLASLAKAFGLKLMKGYFPHLFNLEENQNYIGPIPGEEFFDLTFSAKNVDEIKKFREWHASQRYEILILVIEQIGIFKTSFALIALTMLRFLPRFVKSITMKTWRKETALRGSHLLLQGTVIKLFYVNFQLMSIYNCLQILRQMI